MTRSHHAPRHPGSSAPRAHTHMPSFSLDNRIVSVIGAASGIGEAVAVGLAAHGALVVVLDINTDGARQLAERIATDGGRAEARAIDLGDDASVTGAFEDIQARHGRIDGMVCTPAVNVRKLLLDYTDDEYDRVVDLNLKGSFRILRAAGRIMVLKAAGASCCSHPYAPRSSSQARASTPPPRPVSSSSSERRPPSSDQPAFASTQSPPASSRRR